MKKTENKERNRSAKKQMLAMIEEENKNILVSNSPNAASVTADKGKQLILWEIFVNEVDGPSNSVFQIDFWITT